MPPVVVGAHLPDRPATLGKKVDLPPVIIGESTKVFALKNRAVAIEANNRIEAGAAYDDELRAGYGAKE